MCKRWSLALSLVVLRGILGGAPLGAQEAPAEGSDLVRLGSPLEERIRLSELLGEERRSDEVIRSLSSQLPAVPPGPASLEIHAIDPALVGVHNSNIPKAFNDGGLWSGRGANVSFSAGARVGYGRLRLVLLPEVTYSENRPFALPETRQPGRSSFSAPWYVGTFSADLPTRFGDSPLPQLGLGQSSLSVDVGGARLALATENQWWGPSVRNAIVMSNSAPGFPHAFAQTAAPLRTRYGAFAGKLIAGLLTESLFFDTVAANDRRMISGFVGTFSPAREPDLTLGLARTVVTPARDGTVTAGGLTGSLTRWRNTSNAPEDSAFQIVSLFARWVFPADGFEIYSEWARMALPSSPLALFDSPAYTQGYTFGLQWARKLERGDLLRIHSEFTYLEESATYDRLPTRSFYVSPSVVQGYTERGQPLGAAIGPGGSSQWIAADLFEPYARLGVFAGRVRFGNDVYYTLPVGRSYLAHDVDVFAGARVGMRSLGVEADASVMFSRRYNFLFQNPSIGVEGEDAVDVGNVTFQLSLYPDTGPLLPRAAR